MERVRMSTPVPGPKPSSAELGRLQLTEPRLWRLPLRRCPVDANLSTPVLPPGLLVPAGTLSQAAGRP